MPVEARTRITLVIPSPTTLPQFFLVEALLTELTRACGGVSASSYLPAVFEGWWLPAGGAQQIERGDITLIVADAPVPLGDTDLALYLDELKPRCQQDFGQDIIWITVHQVSRVTTDDPQPTP